MEVVILKTINFQLGTPTAITFLRLFENLISNYGSETHHNLSSYYVELCLLTPNSADFSDAMLAAASLALAGIVIGIENPWPEKLVSYSNLNITNMQSCMIFIRKVA